MMETYEKQQQDRDMARTLRDQDEKLATAMYAIKVRVINIKFKFSARPLCNIGIDETLLMPV